MNNSSIGNLQIPEEGENILIIFLDSLILLLSLSGNSLVIYTIRKERKLQTTCNYLLLNLAICDIIVVSLGTSIDIMLQFTKSKWILGSFLCHVISPALTMFYISASLILVVISMDRYKMFVHPLKARYQRKHVKYAIIIVHTISLCCVMPFAFFSTITDGYCYDSWPEIWYRKAYTVFLFLMQYAIPLSIMAFAYIGVALSLLRNKSAFKRKFEGNTSTPMKSLVGLPSKPLMHDGTSVTEYSEATMPCYPLSDGKERGMPVILENNGRVSNSILGTNDVNANHTAANKKYNIPKTVENFQNGKKRYSGTYRKSKISDQKHLLNNSSDDGSKTSTEDSLKNLTTPETTPATVKRRLSDRIPMRRTNAIRRRDRSSTISTTPSRRDQRNNRALKMILLVVVVFALFMLPMQIMSLHLDFGGKPTPEKYKIYAWFVMCSYFGSCTLNPFIYGLVDRTFRAGFKKFAKKIAGICKCSSN